MHELAFGDGFAVMNISELKLLFSGSFKKCIEFVSNNKTAAFSEGLAVMSSKCARNIIDAKNIIDSNSVSSRRGV